MVKPRFPGHVEAPSATRRATDKWAHDTMRPEQLDSGSTHTSQPHEGCALLHPLQGVSLLSTPLQGGILKPPALRVVVDCATQVGTGAPIPIVGDTISILVDLLQHGGLECACSAGCQE